MQDNVDNSSCGDSQNGHINGAGLLQGLQEKSTGDPKQARRLRAFCSYRFDLGIMGTNLADCHDLSPALPLLRLRENLPQIHLFLNRRNCDTRDRDYWPYVARFEAFGHLYKTCKGITRAGLRRFFTGSRVFCALDTLGVTGSNPVAPNPIFPGKIDAFWSVEPGRKVRKVPTKCRKGTTRG